MEPGRPVHTHLCTVHTHLTAPQAPPSSHKVRSKSEGKAEEGKEDETIRPVASSARPLLSRCHPDTAGRTTRLLPSRESARDCLTPLPSPPLPSLLLPHFPPSLSHMQPSSFAENEETRKREEVINSLSSAAQQWLLPSNSELEP